MKNSNQIKIGALISYTAIAFNIVSGLLYTPWMVNTIGKNQYGLYTLANSLIMLFLVDFGLSSATGRYLSKYNAQGDRESAERFLGAIYKLYLIIDAVIFTVLTVLFFFLNQIYAKLTPQELEQFKVVYVIAALFSVTNFPFVTFNGILTAYEKFIPLKMADLLYRVFNIGFTVIALLLGYGLYALVTVHAVVGLLTVLAKFIIIKKTVPLRVNFRAKEKGMYKEIFSFSIWVTVSALALRLVFNITPSVLGITVGAGSIAVFGIVSTIEGYTYNITTAINGMFMPRISKLLVRDQDEEKLNQLFLLVGKYQFVINGLIVAGLAVVGEQFVTLWMGEGFREAYLGILLVVVPGLFYNSLQIANTTMVVMNKVKMTAFVNVLTGVVNVALSFPLSKLLGVIGACLSICIAYFVRDIALNILYHKVLPLNIPKFIGQCYLRMLVPLALTVAIGLGMNYLISGSGWILFLLKAGFVAVVYFVLTLLLGLDRQERAKMVGMIKRKHG